MADGGFDDRRLPDGRVLRLCSREAGSTISDIGRELGITRQGAGKVVEYLCDRGYVTVANSAVSRREKSVVLTSRGIDYLRALRVAAHAIEEELRAKLGEAEFSALTALLDALDHGEQKRMSTYLRRSTSGGPPSEPGAVAPLRPEPVAEPHPDRQVIPIACALDDQQADARLDKWELTLAPLVIGAERSDPGRLRLTLRDDPAGVATLIGLARAEKACCPFFDFTLDIGTEAVSLVVEVTTDAQAVLDDFARLAGTT